MSNNSDYSNRSIFIGVIVRQETNTHKSTTQSAGKMRFEFGLNMSGFVFEYNSEVSKYCYLHLYYFSV